MQRYLDIPGLDIQHTVRAMSCLSVVRSYYSLPIKYSNKNCDEMGAGLHHGKTNIISFYRLIKFFSARTVMVYITNFNWFLVWISLVFNILPV